VIYSVWKQASGTYDYYESSREQPTLNVEKPSHIRGSSTLGATVLQAAWPLPADAKLVGSGEQAVGRVAAKGGQGGFSSVGDVSFDDPLVKAGVFVGIGVLLWKFVAKPKRRRA
jgi:hypothetical protein